MRNPIMASVVITASKWGEKGSTTQNLNALPQSGKAEGKGQKGAVGAKRQRPGFLIWVIGIRSAGEMKDKKYTLSNIVAHANDVNNSSSSLLMMDGIERIFMQYHLKIGFFSYPWGPYLWLGLHTAILC